MKTIQHIDKIKRLTVTALFCAVAYVVSLAVQIAGIGGFLTFDIKDAVITVAAMLFGPLTGIVISFVVALLEMTGGSGTGHWGAIMNFTSSAVFACVASGVYRHLPKWKKTVAGAWGGLGLAILATVLTMLGLNLVITPLYTGMSVGGVAALILPLLLPFNAIKYVMNAALVMILYKPLASALRRSGFLPKSSAAKEPYFNRTTLIIFLISAAVSVVCVYLLIAVFGGHLEWFKG